MRRFESALTGVTTTGPRISYWAVGFLISIAAHATAAGVWLWRSGPAPIIGIRLEDQGIGVSLGPQEAPPPEVEEEPEPEEIIEERAEDAPPPEPPAEEIEEEPEPEPPAPPREIWIGDATGGDLTLEEYLLVEDWLEQARYVYVQRLRYPEEARRAALEGVAEVIVTVDSRGRVQGWRFSRRTDIPILDREVERVMRSVRRHKPFPQGIRYTRLSFRLPVRFEIYYPDGFGPTGN